MFDEYLFTVEEAALILKQDVGTVYRWLAVGKLRGNRRGKRGSWEIPASELQYWVGEKLTEAEKTILDIARQVWSMKRSAGYAERKSYEEALDELLLGLSRQFDAARAAKDVGQIKARISEIAVSDSEATDESVEVVESEPTLESLRQLAALRRRGKIGDEELRDILVERDWVEVYERLTDEMILVYETDRIHSI
ncbi:helix-turn-helix domain-containing protein [Paenibacillus methanolicus]|uniref:Excisionase family DNA binding protein n=1 Tax=Paenibacillus methanolicus TaxID=582686 RepID=A0A5S5CK18_9BACL|nr:helix-turn-helix domain-containing protein [Paenibacillus methanolicus]TYP79844.1 excisionase family DNA binding protein [Paenibacillus methanolicus]